MESFFVIILPLVLGYIASKGKIFDEKAPLILNQFIIYIALPALILLKIPTISFSYDILVPVVVSWSSMIGSAIIILLLSKLLNFTKEVTGSLLLVGVLGNTSFLGIPLVTSYFGQDALAYIIIYDQLGTFLALATYGTLIVSLYSNKSSFKIKDILKKLITFPPFVALVIAFIIKDFSYPNALSKSFEMLSYTIVPLALFSVGLQLQFKLQSDVIKPFSVALVTKLIFAPIIAYAVCYILGYDGFIANVSIMESAMGPMITAGVVATAAGLAPRLSSAIVGYGILFSFISVYILNFLFF
ncbi:AEC family transporter [Arcobacter sp. FWKO B]|uniref:AEC family transporter n=1 Tax=Arcobacter sp. FWKO B TaxID=2593672 RepID=UPI0018A688D5|nr:AEC family transporter [Arcobacter sp. FWKO B]QOG11723.1 AEC family transporter [Arcobacter sp. FWKO B]